MHVPSKLHLLHCFLMELKVYLNLFQQDNAITMGLLSVFSFVIFDCCKVMQDFHPSKIPKADFWLHHIKCWVPVWLCDSHTSHSAALLL